MICVMNRHISRPGWILPVLVTLLTRSPALSATEPDYRSFEEPAPNSVLDLNGPFVPVPEPKERPVTRIRNFLWNDASLLLAPRSYYMDNQRDDSNDREAWALGGALQYRSGSFRERFSLGATVYTSQKLHGPSDKDGTLLLKSGQNGFTVLGEAYAAAQVGDSAELRAWRQTLNLPYVNKQDNRMAPNTFAAYTLSDFSHENYKYIAGHVTHMKKRNASSFEHISEAAGAGDTDKGLSMIGALYSPTPRINIGAINYQAWDVMNIFYAEGNAAWEIGADAALRVSGQFTDQRSTGDELVGDFETGMAGIKLDASYKHGILTLARTWVDNDATVRSPFGGYPGFASIIIQDFNRAGEDAWLIGLSYEFSRIGLDGLSAFTTYVSSDTPDNGSAASPDQQEIDFTVDYRFTGDFLEGLWIRARAAFVDQDGSGAEDIDDYRLILNYSLPLQ
jgi:hypothetical protein